MNVENYMGVRDYNELVQKVEGFFVKGSKGKHLFGDASKQEGYCNARKLIAEYEERLIDEQHTSLRISPLKLEEQLKLLDDLRQQIREQHGKVMEARQ